MKPSFSFRDALSAPFVMLRRRPVYLFAWGLMMTVLMGFMYVLAVPVFAAFYGLTTALFGDGTFSSAALDQYVLESPQLSVAINAMNILIYLVMLMVWTAASRSALSPAKGDRFLFLRLGMDEVRVAVGIIAIFVGWYLALLILVLIGAALGLALWSVSEAAAVGVVIVYGLAVFGGSIWVLVRLSLIAPASLILKEFAFATGWRIARGQVWKLIGLNLVVWVVYLLSAIVTYAIVIGILAAGFFGQGLTWPADVQTVADLEPVFRPMIAPLLVTAIPFAMGFGWIMTLYAAPSIVAARQLLDGVRLPMPIVEDAPPANAVQTP